MKCILSTFFLPVLSAQFITAPTGRPKAIRNLAPAEPPRPENKNKIEVKIYIFWDEIDESALHKNLSYILQTALKK